MNTPASRTSLRRAPTDRTGRSDARSRRLGRLFALVLALFSLPVAALDEPAGRVELVEGDTTVRDNARQARKIAVGDAVFPGESLVTGRDGEVHVKMEDGGLIAVRPNTDLRIVAFQAQGRSDDKGVFGLVQGAFRSITGWIGRYNPKNYQVRTPTATIGIRGTDHEPLVIPEGSREGEPGTYDKVNAGATTLQTKHGRVDLAPGQAGFVPRRGRPAPRLLKAVPAFYRPTRNEPLLATRHEAIQKSLEQRRIERRQAVESRKASAVESRKTATAERQKARETREARRKAQEAERAKRRDDTRRWQDQPRKRGVESGPRPRDGRGGSARAGGDAGRRGPREPLGQAGSHAGEHGNRRRGRD